MTRSATPAMSLAGSTFLGSVVRAAVNLARALRHRREIMNLAEFDDRMLKDIGLVRSDVEGALAEPIVRNPSSVLVRCVERRSRAERMVPPGRATRPVIPVVKPARLCA
ncbi:DUF1127 domain-containing protein [Microvirga alba]|uniref:DUF1127 domain-containing protein n=1 Tax=Microvirga alba TaxID=2791025 RepID=A0A931FQH3_9HYPH|nr:DUF1127 domain-containing protein [Microvirga alba]MBF9231786.1 DUF1127 domain-containing protein [Microvirga alba]